MKRCKHQNAEVKSQSEHLVRVECCDCDQGWLGQPYAWYSRRGKKHVPPKWVLKAIERSEMSAESH